MYNIAVLISGNGTNLQALLDAERGGMLPRGKIKLVVSSRSDAGGLARAAAAGVHNVFIPKSDPEKLIKTICETDIDFIILSGYLSMLPEELVCLFPNRIVNHHASLIPLFCGKGYYGMKVHEAVIASGMKITGVTVHFADENYDTGIIISQRVVPVMPGDTPEILRERVLAVEHVVLVETVAAWTEGRVVIKNGKAFIRKKPRAIISVYYKKGAAEIARALHEAGYELVSTGSTAEVLKSSGLPVTPVENVTNFPECMDGRVKTLHPKIFAGILAVRDSDAHLAVMDEHDISPVDVVVSNLYPFKETIAEPGCVLPEAIEKIDIGGPSMVRAAAKNYRYVSVLTSPSQYGEFISRLKNGQVDEAYRFKLSSEAFAHTAEYDRTIAKYLNENIEKLNEKDKAGIMSVLVVGGGGREHAIGWKLAQSPRIGNLFFAPGNGGTCELGKNIGIPATDIEALAVFAKQNNIGLTVVGPEIPLQLGIADLFAESGLPVFGPEKKAAMLETSKIYSKAFMDKYGIPTAQYEIFYSADGILDNLPDKKYPLWIKADGLAAGKGAVYCADLNAARHTVNLLMKDKIFGEAGAKVVLEEDLRGPEVTLLCVTDGETIIPFETAGDYKRALDYDLGENTGGMGSVSPALYTADEICKNKINLIVQKTLDGIKAEGLNYR
ncbi:MAG: phosphoribosylamine--glycine ligase, partial [Defluviitaleaceae bacterium]|nr:phosphoribosylamine--glycine ligase [Defluviitaleaceae bacterium]